MFGNITLLKYCNHNKKLSKNANRRVRTLVSIHLKQQQHKIV